MIVKTAVQQQWSISHMNDGNFEVLDQATVDGATWYTVSCRKDVSMWVREHGIENKEWFDHIDSKWMLHKNVFDMHEELYTYLKLSWGE